MLLFATYENTKGRAHEQHLFFYELNPFKLTARIIRPRS